MTGEVPSCRLCDQDHRRGSEECPARRVGKLIAGKYQITHLLGAGGMGAVYRAKHAKLGTEVAIKMVHAKFGLNSDIARRFELEAQHAAALRHPGIVVVSDLGRDDDGTPYLEMELLAGKSVDELVRSGVVTADRAVRLAIQALDALAFAHEKGVIHRDIKPENLFVTFPNGVDQLKVVDFGIAKALTGPGVTSTGSVMGTPLYMSPEQFQDAKRVTAASDVYSMGAALYEMLTGVPPIRKDATLPEVMSKVMLGEIDREPSKLNAELPHWVDDVVRRALAHDPTERYQTAREMKEALEQRMIGGALVGAVANAGSPVVVAATLPPDSPSSRPEPPAVSKTAFDGSSPSEPPGDPTELDRNPAGANQGKPAVSDVVKVVHAVTKATTPPGRAPDSSTAPPERVVAAVSVVGDPPRRRNVVPIAIGGVVVVGGAIAYFATRGGGAPTTRPEPTRDAAVVADATATVDSPAPPPAPPGMVKLPGGTFEMGSTATEVEGAYKLCLAVAVAGAEKGGCSRTLYDREQPLRKVTVSPFYLDIDEVTNEAVVAWLKTSTDLTVRGEVVTQKTGTPYLDLHPEHGGIVHDGKTWRVRTDRGRRPAVQLSWHAATDYCAAQGKRLPTEAQWEFAARGTERRRFPWGNGLLVNDGDSNACDGAAYARGPKMDCAAKGAHAADVGTSKVDTTKEGIHDLGANATEWVIDTFADRYADCAGCKDPVFADLSNKQASVRGGYWAGLIEAARGAGRSRLDRDKMKHDLGFRCAKPVEGM